MAPAPDLVAHPRRFTDLLLVRHGQTDWNLLRRIQGQDPVPLNDEGRAQATRAAGALAGVRPAAMISSPVRRAVETAEVLAGALGFGRPLELEPGLREFEMGDWDGRFISELRPLSAWQRYITHPHETTFPGGESLEGIRTRAVEAINARVAAAEGGTLLAVSHGGIIRLLALTALGMPLSSYHRIHVENATLTHIRLLPGLPPRVMALGHSAEPIDAL